MPSTREQSLDGRCPLPIVRNLVGRAELPAQCDSLETFTETRY